MSNTLQSAERAVQILLAFETEGQEIGVSELAERLGVHKSTASRLAATLRKHGLLERAPDSERFRLGHELGRLGLLAFRGRDLIEVARRPMADLSEETAETVTLAVRHDGELATVAQVDARYLVGVQNWLGRRTPLHCTSDGKVMLAFDRGTLPEAPLERCTKHTITNRRLLQSQLDEIRRRGWASALGELEEGLHGVAAPVFDDGGRCRAALSVSGPSYRLAAEDLPRVAEHAIAAARRIASGLVWSSNGAQRHDHPPTTNPIGAEEKSR